jgi:hypothetical protein
MAASDSDSDFEPATEALDIAMEDLQTAYTSIVHHLNVAAKGLKEIRAQQQAAAVRETELVAAIERAKASAQFGPTLLQELEKFEQTGRPKTVDTSTKLSNNGHTESLSTSSD